MENAIVEEMPREVRDPPGASQGQPGAEAGEPGEPVRGRGAHKPARGGTRGNRREGPRGLHLASTPGPGGRAAGDWLGRAARPGPEPRGGRCQDHSVRRGAERRLPPLGPPRGWRRLQGSDGAADALRGS